MLPEWSLGEWGLVGSGVLAVLAWLRKIFLALGLLDQVSKRLDTQVESMAQFTIRLQKVEARQDVIEKQFAIYLKQQEEDKKEIMEALKTLTNEVSELTKIVYMAMGQKKGPKNGADH